MRERPSLRVKIGDLELRNPIILASGTIGRTGRGLKRFAEAGCAAVISKTITKERREGNPSPRLITRFRQQHEVYLINSEGLPNIGLKAFAREIKVAKDGNLVVASIGGASIEEFVEVAVELEKAGADAIEINGACPHTFGTRLGSHWSRRPKTFLKLIQGVKEVVSVPVWAKFVTLDSNHLRLARAAENGGADAVVPASCLQTLPIDANTGKPMLGNPYGIGNATGPHMKFAGIRLVADVARLVKIPVIGTGGCLSGLDIIEYLMAGASAVEVLTVFIRKGPGVVRCMTNDIEQFMAEKHYESLDEIIGMTLTHLPSKPYRY